MAASLPSLPRSTDSAQRKLLSGRPDLRDQWWLMDQTTLFGEFLSDSTAPRPSGTARTGPTPPSPATACTTPARWATTLASPWERTRRQKISRELSLCISRLLRRMVSQRESKTPWPTPPSPRKTLEVMFTTPPRSSRSRDLSPTRRESKPSKNLTSSPSPLAALLPRLRQRNEERADVMLR